MNPIRSLCVLVVLLSVAAFAQPSMAQNLSLQPAGAGDLVPTVLSTAPRRVVSDLERASVEFFQPLPADALLDVSPPPFQAESREYWQRVDDRQLRAGYALALTAPGAVVLLSPALGAEPLRIDQLVVLDGKARLAADAAVDTLVDDAALRAAGMEVQRGSLGFRLRADVSHDARIQVAGADGEYLLHVLEPASRDVLRLAGRADTVHAGSDVTVDVALLGGARMAASTGLLMAPDGRSWPLRFEAGGRVGQVRVPTDAVAGPGLWDVRVMVAGQDGARAFQRDARIALAVVAPGARLDGAASLQRRADGARVTAFGLDVAVAGRYELRGVLYGRDRRGVTVPVGVAHVAAWLSPGQAALSLAWPAQAMSAASGPYEIRDLRLADQGQVALLERRAQALHFD